jgi:hypothetical protein
MAWACGEFALDPVAWVGETHPAGECYSLGTIKVTLVPGIGLALEKLSSWDGALVSTIHHNTFNSI